MMIAILLLLWFLCGEKPKELNLKRAAWWQGL